MLAIVTCVAIPAVDARQPAVLPSPAGAQTSVSLGGLTLHFSPVLGPDGWLASSYVELVVRAHNTGTRPFHGHVHVENRGYGSPFSGNADSTVKAKLTVAPGARVRVHLPVDSSGARVTHLKLVDDTSGAKRQVQLEMAPPASMTLVDAAPRSPLQAGIHDAVRWHQQKTPASAPTLSPADSIVVFNVATDAQTSDPILPRFGFGYAAATLVHLTSDQLVRLSNVELQALGHWVLAGGTLALSVVRPEDIRHQRLQALCGSNLSRSPTPTDAESGKPVLSRFSGGHLKEGPLSSSATYGLGNVHLLAFDASTNASASSLEAMSHLVALTADAKKRKNRSLLSIAAPKVKRRSLTHELDPNVESRWPLSIATLLLILYAVVAGPLNFNRNIKHKKPLNSLRMLPLMSLGTFGVIVAIGALSKGCSDRSRRLVYAELGAGMTRGHAVRWRSFFGPSAKMQSVQVTEQGHLLAVAPGSNEAAGSVLVSTREGLRIDDLRLQPWRAAVANDSGLIEIDGPIAVRAQGPKEIAIINRTGRQLRGLLLWDERGKAHYAERLSPGQTLLSTAMTPTSRCDIPSGSRGRLFTPTGCSEQLDAASEGLADAWQAVRLHTAPRNWNSPGAPVLIAQMDGGDGDERDTGIRIEHNRLLVRIVGYGGHK